MGLDRISRCLGCLGHVGVLRCTGAFGGARNGARCRLLGGRVGTIGIVRNLFWREVRWGVEKRRGTHVRLWI